MGGAMSVGDFIRSVFPSTVNREGKIFGALLANDTETGTIERIFNDIEVVRDDWYRTSPYAMHDTTYVEGRSSSGQLSTTFNFLSVLQRNAYDDDATYIKRMQAIFEREQREVWGTVTDVQKTMGKLLGGDKAGNTYIVTGTGAMNDNLLTDPDFEVLTGASEGKSQWTAAGCEYDKTEARFEGTASVILGAGGSVTQSVVLEKGAHFLHTFIKGDVNVSITDSTGNGFSVDDGEGADTQGNNGNAKGMGHWEQGTAQIPLHSDKWCDKRIAFTVGDIPDITITITGAGEGAEVDWTRLYKALPYPTFSLISVSDMLASKKPGVTAFMAPGHDDHPTDIDDKNYWTETGKVDGGIKEVAHIGEGEAWGYTDMEDGSTLEMDYDKMAYIGHSAVLGASLDVIGGSTLAIWELLCPAGVVKHFEKLARVLDGTGIEGKVDDSN